MDNAFHGHLPVVVVDGGLGAGGAGVQNQEAVGHIGSPYSKNNKTDYELDRAMAAAMGDGVVLLLRGGAAGVDGDGDAGPQHHAGHLSPGHAVEGLAHEIARRDGGDQEDVRVPRHGAVVALDRRRRPVGGQVEGDGPLHQTGARSPPGRPPLSRRRRPRSPACGGSLSPRHTEWRPWAAHTPESGTETIRFVISPASDSGPEQSPSPRRRRTSACGRRARPKWPRGTAVPRPGCPCPAGPPPGAECRSGASP